MDDNYNIATLLAQDIREQADSIMEQCPQYNLPDGSTHVLHWSQAVIAAAIIVAGRALRGL